MPCYHPLDGWRSQTVNPSGKRSITFKASNAYLDLPEQVPCGQCIGCRLERSRQWAIRCVHEAQLHEQNAFITLTFDEKHYPKDGSLHLADFQKFMKRLRKHVKTKIRFFHCGEYGENFNRPHHHACIFGYDFPDKKLWSQRKGSNLYRSEMLEKIWPFGYCTIGDVTFESAAYVARYVTKKILGKNADQYYQGRKPEYVTMSRRPGIGHEWYKKFKDDLYPHDFVVIRNGIKCKIPKYYDTQNSLTNEKQMLKLKSRRRAAAKANPDNTDQRLAVKEQVKQEQVKLLKREMEK